MVIKRPKKASSFLRPTETGTKRSNEFWVLRWGAAGFFYIKAYYKPYLSKKRKTNVSVMVMRTPAHSGILRKRKPIKETLRITLLHFSFSESAVMCYLPTERRLKAIAQPMTSCMSEPIIANSTISQRRIRGTWQRTESEILTTVFLY